MQRPYNAFAITLTTVAGLYYWACSPPVREFHAAIQPHDAGTPADAGGEPDADASACTMQCSGATPFCDEPEKICVACLSDETCPDPDAAACVSGVCEACTANSQCAHLAKRSICKTSAASDAGVTDNDAGANLGSCVQCVSHQDCSRENPVCDPDTNECVQCASNADCPSASASRCIHRECAPCESNADCTNMGDKTVCSLGVCVKPTVVELALAQSHSCARLSDGTLRCWGLNYRGQLGDGTTTMSNSPVKVSNISTAVALSAGWMQSCALLSNGTVQCWGENRDGVLGDTNVDHSAIPIPVPGVTGARQMAIGGQTFPGFQAPSFGATAPDGPHACAVFQPGNVYCWGSNLYGQLGTGDTRDRSQPSAVANLSTATQIAIGGRTTCARLNDGTVQCWGGNSSGELGDDTTAGRTTPATVPLSGSQFIGAGREHACSLSNDTTVSCWGSNAKEQLGNGTTTNSPFPVLLSNLSHVSAIAVGGFHACALLSGGTLQCWGDNSYGQLGNGTNTGGQRVAVMGLTQAAVGVAAGGMHTCALLNDNSVVCWGHNDAGQLGTGNNSDGLLPLSVVGLSP